MAGPGDLVVILDKHRQMCALDKGRLAADLAAILAEEVGASLDAEQDVAGERFAELSERYARWKATHAPGRPIGELSGALKAAVREIPDGIRVVFDRMYIDLAPGDPELRVYAIAFNDGVPERNQPPRPFLGFSQRCQDRMAARIRQHVATGLAGGDR